MNAIYSAFCAIANFARALNRLAAVADAVAGEAERRVELIGHVPAVPAPQMPAESEPALNGSAESTRKRR